MKKLLIACATIAIAFGAQAATVNWSASKVYQPETTTAGAGYAVYMFWTATEGAAYDLSQFAGIADGDMTILSSKEWLGATSATGKVSGSKDIAGVVTDGSKYAAALVVFDAASAEAASNYFVAASPVVQSSTIAGSSVTFAFGSQAEANWTSIATVPEPTSGLLMLLGMGALALRRRRA